MFTTSYKYLILIFIGLIVCVLSSCSNSDYTPKPRGFFRIDFPKREYTKYNADCPFEFEYPVYAKIVRDEFPGAEPCWLNIEFPQFKGTLHLSYKVINKNLRNFTEDSRTLAMRHTVKAEAINENPFITPNHIYGMMYDIEGNTASSIQFYLTDSTKNFLRVSLYFNVVPQSDSLAPVIDFVKKDITRMIDTFKWKE